MKFDHVQKMDDAVMFDKDVADIVKPEDTIKYIDADNWCHSFPEIS